MPGLPNILSFFRIAAIPFLVYYLSTDGPSHALIALCIFFVASLTDYLDGYVARKHGETTILGTFLDPLADKLLVMAVLITLVGGVSGSRLPAWMVVLIVGREMAVTGLRSVAAGEGLILPADRLGKLKTLLQLLALHALILGDHFDFFNFHPLGIYVLWLALVLGLWSGLSYYRKVAGHLRSAHLTRRPRE